MGVDYRAMLYVGQEFEDEHHAKKFFTDNVELSEEDEEFIDGDGLQEYLYSHDDLDGDTIDCYSGYGFLLGVEISCHNPETFLDDYNKAVETWKEYFGDAPFYLINTVKVY